MAVVAGALLAGGCSNVGDPGGKRLAGLSADPIVAVEMPGSSGHKKTETPASFYKEGDSRPGPKVVVWFKTSAGPEDVYRYYGGQAAHAGWIADPRGLGVLGMVDTWTKRYPDGAGAGLELEEIGHSGEWELTGRIGAVDDG